jgi:hypothetical protein
VIRKIESKQYSINWKKGKIIETIKPNILLFLNTKNLKKLARLQQLTTIILATWEVSSGGSWSEANPG